MRDLTWWLVLALTAIVAVVLTVGGVVWLYSTNCQKAWSRSGMQYEYNVLQGCLVQRKDGTWIPANAYRETN